MSYRDSTGHVHTKDVEYRMTRVGDWSVHLSSSGRNYYFNRKTKVSQWHKPKEWIEEERNRLRHRERGRKRGRGSDRSYISYIVHLENRSSSTTSNSSSSRDCLRKAATRSSNWSISSSSDSDSRSRDPRRNRPSLKKETHEVVDMDISPGDETCRSGISYASNFSSTQQQRDWNFPALIATQKKLEEDTHVIVDMDISPDDSSPSAEVSRNNDTTQSQPDQNLAGPLVPTTPSPGFMYCPIAPVTLPVPATLPVSTIITTSNAPEPPITYNVLPTSAFYDSTNEESRATMGLTRQTEPESNAVHTLGINDLEPGVEELPMSTHSKTPDRSEAVSTPLNSSPVSNVSTVRGIFGSVPVSEPQGSSVIPPLVNHYGDDLVNHAEFLENQAQQVSKEVHLLSSIQYSRASAELKCAKSLLHYTEIRAAAYRKRLSNIRQRRKQLEEWKPDTSFMSDDA